MITPHTNLRNWYLCTLLLLALGIATLQAANLAPLGEGIIGVNAAVDDTPGRLLFHGSGTAINDENPNNSVDNWSGGSDGGWGISFVGVLWPEVRYERIDALTLTLATFGDGGWFGPNGMGPAAGGPLSAEYLTVPAVQVSTNGGASWTTVTATTDYLTVGEGAPIGGGGNPTPYPLQVTFALTSSVTNINGLRIIGPNGGLAGPDANGFIGVAELIIDSTFADADGDGMPDGWEAAYGLNVGSDDSAGDADTDGLPNLQEYQGNLDPKDPDTDNDGYSDGVEVAQGSDPKRADSIPGNLARSGQGIIGTRSDAGVDMEIANAGTPANINDGIPTTRVDTWNNQGTDKQSYVGIIWTEALTNLVLRLELRLATFGDGGWFGPNNRGPGEGRPLTSTHLTAPSVQVSFDSGLTWSNVAGVSDYLTALNGHAIGGGTNINPSFATARFVLDPPITGISGIRLLGSEGGTASGGFLGVGELAVYARTDSEPDGMDDDWERQNDLIVGFNDAALDPDNDGLTNVQEYQNVTQPQTADTDNDGLLDGAEIATHHTNPTGDDTDQDGLKDGAEVNTYYTNPLSADTDADLFADGLEVQLGSDPTTAAGVPANQARRADAAGILGTMDVPGGIETPVFNAGAAGNIIDGDELTRVDTYNGISLDTLSFVGVVWTNSLPVAIAELEFTMATFFDGGWFGLNASGPGAGGVLSTNLDVIAPWVQITTNGVDWIDAVFATDYPDAVEGHALPAVAFGAPTSVKSRFQLTPPAIGLMGVRLLGSEGGTASGGFLGVFEFEALAKIETPPSLLNATVVGGQFRFEFDTETGKTYAVQYKNAMSDAAWLPLSTIVGDGTRKPVTNPLTTSNRFYRVMRQ